MGVLVFHKKYKPFFVFKKYKPFFLFKKYKPWLPYFHLISWYGYWLSETMTQIIPTSAFSVMTTNKSWEILKHSPLVKLWNSIKIFRARKRSLSQIICHFSVQMGKIKAKFRWLSFWKSVCSQFIFHMAWHSVTKRDMAMLASNAKSYYAESRRNALLLPVTSGKNHSSNQTNSIKFVDNR